MRAKAWQREDRHPTSKSTSGLVARIWGAYHGVEEGGRLAEERLRAAVPWSDREQPSNTSERRLLIKMGIYDNDIGIPPASFPPPPWVLFCYGGAGDDDDGDDPDASIPAVYALLRLLNSHTHVHTCIGIHMEASKRLVSRHPQEPPCISRTMPTVPQRLSESQRSLHARHSIRNGVCLYACLLTRSPAIRP